MKEEYKALFEKMKGKQKEKVNRSLSLRMTENVILKDFLDENDITLPSFMMYLFILDDAVSDELLDEYFDMYKKVKKDFLTFEEFTFEYKSKYDDVDFKEVLANEKNIIKGFNLNFVLDFYIQKHWKAKGFISFIQYVKYLFEQAEIYPAGFYEEIQKYIRTNFLDDDKKTKGYLRKQALAKKLRKQKDMKVISLDENMKYHSSAFTIKVFEKEEIVDKFIEYLNKKGITFSQLVRYELVENELLSLEDAFLEKKVITKIKKINFKAKARLKDTYAYRDALKASKDYKTVMVILANDEKMLSKLKNNFGTWVRHFVLRKYGVFPKFGVRDVSRHFINDKRLEHFM